MWWQTHARQRLGWLCKRNPSPLPTEAYSKTICLEQQEGRQTLWSGTKWSHSSTRCRSLHLCCPGRLSDVPSRVVKNHSDSRQEQFASLHLRLYYGAIFPHFSLKNVIN